MLGKLLGIAVWLTATTLVASDTLVLCPNSLQPALGEWLDLRKRQGHTLTVVAPAETEQATRAIARREFDRGDLRYVVLVGDVADPDAPPCNYQPLEVIRRWGPDPTVATDYGYADLTGDAAPEVAVGRIPCTSADELHDYLVRVVEHEANPTVEWANAEMGVVASPGNFSPWLDRILESAATNVLTQTTPPSIDLNVLYASPGSRYHPGADRLHTAVVKSLKRPTLAWVYLGHGLPYEVDSAPSLSGRRPLLDVKQFKQTPPGPSPPIAALLACYTGAFDARRPCLAEAMLSSRSGPLCVIAASRVTMPYGNSLFGLQLMNGLFHAAPTSVSPLTAGEVILEAKQRLLEPPAKTGLPAMLEQIASGVATSADRQQERLEHAFAYNLLGDPLLTLRTPQVASLAASLVDGRINLTGATPIAGVAQWRLASDSERASLAPPAWQDIGKIKAGPFETSLELPHNNAEAPQQLLFRVLGESSLAIGDAHLQKQKQVATTNDNRLLR